MNRQFRFSRVVALLIGFCALGVPAWGRSISTTNARTTRVDDSAGRIEGARVVVFPFTNLSKNPADEWFGLGLAETVTAELNIIPGISVVHAGPAREARDRGPVSAGAWVLRGAYQRSGDRIRITASLVSPGALVYTAKVDGTVHELFVLQDQVAEALSRHVTGVETAGSHRQVDASHGIGESDGAEGGHSPSSSFVARGTLELGTRVAAASTGVSVGSAPITDAPADDPAPASTALPPGERYRVEPRRVEQGPRVDGSLDEGVWLSAAVIDDFVQQEPSEGDPATERTVVRLLYDARTLYIGVEAYDSQPDGVIATEQRRDSQRLLDEDNFQIILDTFRDRRSGYMFVTNPLGAKLEQQVAEEGEGGFRGNSSNINVNWDGVWHVATRRTADGWVAEIGIPMVTLRFPRAEQQIWGVNFMRNIRRKNEQVFWAPITKEYSLTRVSLAGTMTGLNGVNRGLDLRVTPYVLAGGEQERVETRLDASGFSDVGLDVKYGVASGLNLDLTLNTDFAQVEIDEQQVNLTRFPLFFPEKRDFFLENAGMFSVKTQGFGRKADLFFTRRIGLSDGGQPIPIIGGARLTGKVRRHNIAVMNITTQEAIGDPGANFFVGRYSRDILARSKVGGLVINKEATGGGSHYNRTFAADTTLALHRNFVMNGFIAKTETPGISTGDLAGYVKATWLSPSWRIYSEYTDIQDHFNAEVGFVSRVGVRTSKFHGEWDPRPGKVGHPPARPDVEHRLHDRPAQPAVDAAHASHDGHLLRGRLVVRRDLQRPLRAARCAVPHPPRRHDPGWHLPLWSVDLPVQQRSVETHLRSGQLQSADVLRRHADGCPGNARRTGDQLDRCGGAAQPEQRRPARRRVHRRPGVGDVRPRAVTRDDAAYAVAIQLDHARDQHERAVQLDLQPRQRHLHRVRRAASGYGPAHAQPARAPLALVEEPAARGQDDLPAVAVDVKGELQPTRSSRPALPWRAGPSRC